MQQKSALEQFLELSKQDRFNGWPLAGDIKKGVDIPWFGSSINYQLQVGETIEDYTSIIRSFGWVVVFGVTKDGFVPTLCQWKPGVNQASWELPPGGIGKLSADASMEDILTKTQASYMKETGYGEGHWSYLGFTMIETGKYRGASPDDHGLKAHMYVASGLQKIAEARNPSANEIMETIMVPLDEFREVLESGKFTETSAVACAYKALIHMRHLDWD